MFINFTFLLLSICLLLCALGIAGVYLVYMRSGRNERPNRKTYNPLYTTLFITAILMMVGLVDITYCYWMYTLRLPQNQGMLSAYKSMLLPFLYLGLSLFLPSCLLIIPSCLTQKHYRRIVLLVICVHAILLFFIGIFVCPAA